VGTRADFARYNAVFYLLHKLEVGDKIEIVYQGTLYKYSVEKKEILTAHDLKYFDPGVREERLVLQTCYPPGTAWKRMVVVAKRSS
jgi:LPXTG-site transpeptidase (sortase) family protein